MTFGTLRFVARFTETLGWMALMIGVGALLVGLGGFDAKHFSLSALLAIVGSAAPLAVGLVLILLGQVALCFVATEANTRRASEGVSAIVESLMALRGGTVRVAPAAVGAAAGAVGTPTQGPPCWYCGAGGATGSFKGQPICDSCREKTT